MLEMKAACEKCSAELAADADSAFICSFECTFCGPCAEGFDHRCPNCGGRLVARPPRAR
jgi:uncharacterized protein